MKRMIFLFMVAITAISCDLNDDENAAEYVISPVQDVTMPATFKVDSISQIKIRYKRPTDCHIFNGFYYDADRYNRTVAIYFAKLNRSDCAPTENVFEVPLDFKPKYAGTYTFKFWDGSNEDGTDHFTEYQAVVRQ